MIAAQSELPHQKRFTLICDNYIFLGKTMEANTSRMVTLNGVNYAIWKGEMEDLLYVKNFYKPVFTIVKPDNMTDEEWNLWHRQVCGFIRQWVDDNVLNHISGETRALTLWEHLESLYARKTGNNKMFLGCGSW